MSCDKTKLNVGSGKTYLPNYWNLEINRRFQADEYADYRTTDYPNESFTDILCMDTLDHVSFIEAKQALQKFYRWLKPNGTLRIHTPNLRTLAAVLSVTDNEEALMWLYGTTGEGSTNYENNFIRWAYSKESLSKLLKAQGFQIVSANEDCKGFGLAVVAIKR